MDEEGRDPRVGMTIGVTASIGNYQSLKVSVYAEMCVLPGETTTRALDVLQKHLLQELYDRAKEIEGGLRDNGIVR